MEYTSSRVIRLARALTTALLALAPAHAADSERAALESTIQLWMFAVNSQDVPTLTETMTQDVELSDDASTKSGREAAIQALREIVSRGRLLVSTREIAVAGDIGWHSVWLAQAQKNGDIHARGQALEIWKREKGKWRLHRRMASGGDTPAGMLSRPKTGEPVLDPR